jgi:hypothetical protein
MVRSRPGRRPRRASGGAAIGPLAEEGFRKLVKSRNFCLFDDPGSGYVIVLRHPPLRNAASRGGMEHPAGKGATPMAAHHDRPGDSAEGPAPETSTRRLREQSQLDFEIEFFGRVLERDPFFADALRAHGNNLAAKGLYARALQVDRRLVRLQPERYVPWYNLACSYAVLGMIEPAFSALQRALELGYPHLDHLRRDPDLKSLRRDPRFARLLRRY